MNSKGSSGGCFAERAEVFQRCGIIKRDPGDARNNTPEIVITGKVKGSDTRFSVALDVARLTLASQQLTLKP